MGKKSILASGVAALLIAAYALILTASPLPFGVIDRDHSGVVSLGEALDAIDIGQRKTKPDCIEYFWLKDGQPAHEHCFSSIQGQP
jgi:hypothetical protein